MYRRPRRSHPYNWVSRSTCGKPGRVMKDLIGNRSMSMPCFPQWQRCKPDPAELSLSKASVAESNSSVQASSCGCINLESIGSMIGRGRSGPRGPTQEESQKVIFHPFREPIYSPVIESTADCYLRRSTLKPGFLPGEPLPYKFMDKRWFRSE